MELCLCAHLLRMVCSSGAPGVVEVLIESDSVAAIEPVHLWMKRAGSILPPGRSRLPKWQAVRFPLGFLMCVCALLSAFAQAQTASSVQEAETGIIVTRTAEQAESVLHKLKAGMDFGVLAKELSIDPTANDGGYMGRVNLADLPPALHDALLNLHGEKFSGIVPVPAGFAILTVFPAAPNMHEMDVDAMQAQAQAANVRQALNVDGLAEANLAFTQYAKSNEWQFDPTLACTIRKESLAAAIQRTEQVLASEEAGRDKPAPSELIRQNVALAQLRAYSGDMEASIRAFAKAYDAAVSGVPRAVPYLQQALGVAYLHLAGMENGAYRNSGDIDIFPPMHPGEHYAKQENSRQAIKYFLEFLDSAPQDLQVRWLLNLAYVTVGEYPAGVPDKFLMAPSVFSSKQDIGQFKDVAVAAGLKSFASAGGVVVDDFENNGLLDVVTSSKDMCQSMRYFHNNGDGTFTDRTAQAGLSGQMGALNLVEADYNNDGCMDLLLLRGGWELPSRMSLLRNNCNGTFTDVTHAAGLDQAVFSSQTAAWADIDNDGYLDLFVGAEKTPSHLFHNKGDGTFEDISHAAGVDKVAFTKGVAAADFDKDGFVDFYVSNTAGPNFLYHNNHDLTFTDIAKQAGVEGPYQGFATWAFDYDNDGWPDIFVNAYTNFSVDQVMRGYLGMSTSAPTLKLYRNLHNGTFQDVTAETGLDKQYMPMGSNFGDVDNDGYLDIYLGMGRPSMSALMPHVLLRNDQGKQFVDITASSGTGEIHKGHGVSFADLERNGHEDIVTETGGAIPSDGHAMRVFRNPGNDNDWINVRVTGVKSNRSGVGAEIKVTVSNDGHGERSMYRTVGQTSSFGGNPMEQHIGLGHGAKIVNLEVYWPVTNTRQHFNNVAKNEFIEVKEFGSAYTRLKRKTVRLGGGSLAEGSK